MRISFVLFPLLNLSVLVALASSSATADPWPTAGGEPGEIIEVTTLANSGDGSLREALETKGRRTIVFKVAGEIWLDEMLRIRHPFVTVAGETAPSPGITIMGDMVKIRTHDVVLRHIRVRVGALPGHSEPRDRDGIQIVGARAGGDPSYNILIENCSVSWSIDGVLDTYGHDNHDIAIRNSILAEGLNFSIHPEGDHSTGLRIDQNTDDVLIQGNLLAHNKYRNPLIGGGSDVVVANNLIYNPGSHALHFNDGRAGRPTHASVIGNYVIAGPNTRKERLPALDNGLPEGSEIYYEDNVSEGVLAFDSDERVRGSGVDPFVSEAPIWLPALDILPSQEVTAHVLSNSGARPWDRDEVDARLVEEVEARAGEIRDEPTDLRLTGF
jgi:hypothetical protein